MPDMPTNRAELVQTIAHGYTGNLSPAEAFEDASEWLNEYERQAATSAYRRAQLVLRGEDPEKPGGMIAVSYAEELIEDLIEDLNDLRSAAPEPMGYGSDVTES